MNSIVPGTEQYDEFGNIKAVEVDTPQGRHLSVEPFILNLAAKGGGKVPEAIPQDAAVGGFGGPASAAPAAPLTPIPDAGFVGGGGTGFLSSLGTQPIPTTPPKAPSPVPTPPPPFRGPPTPPGLVIDSANQDGTPAAPGSRAGSAGGGVSAPAFATIKDTQETRRFYDPKLEKEQKEIVQKGQEAIKAGLDAELEFSKVAAANAERESQLLENQIESENLRRDAQRQAANDAKRAADAALSKYEGMELEPGRVWANASTGDRMLAGLSMLMGAWGATMTGDKANPAIAAIEKIMDKDLEVQKAAISKGKDVAGMKSSAYRDLLAAHRDEDAAAAGVRELAWKGLASRARAAEAKVKDPAIKAKYQAAAVELEAKANDEALKRSERSVVTTSKQVPLATAGSAIKFGDDVVDNSKALKLTAAKNVYNKADAMLRWAEGLSPADRAKTFGLLDKPADELASWLGITQDPDYIAGKVSRENLKKMALFRLSGQGVPVAEDVKFDAILPNFKNYDNFVNGMKTFRDEMASEYNTEVETAVGSAAHPHRKQMILQNFPILPTTSAVQAKKDKYRAK